MRFVSSIVIAASVIIAPLMSRTSAVNLPQCAPGQVSIYQGNGSWRCEDLPSGSVPTGSIVLVMTGGCPGGFTEVSGLNGLTLTGTLAVNGNVGTTGGVDSITPSGSVTAPVFTGNALSAHTHTFSGNALANHAHELPFYKVAGGTGAFRMIPQSVFGSGTSRAAESTDASTASTTAGAVALSQGVSAGTPAGTNTSVSAGTPSGSNSVPTFNGVQFDNRSAFMRVIFCQKN